MCPHVIDIGNLFFCNFYAQGFQMVVQFLLNLDIRFSKKTEKIFYIGSGVQFATDFFIAKQEYGFIPGNGCHRRG